MIQRYEKYWTFARGERRFLQKGGKKVRNLMEKGPDRCAIFDNPDILWGTALMLTESMNKERRLTNVWNTKKKRRWILSKNERDETLADTCGK